MFFFRQGTRKPKVSAIILFAATLVMVAVAVVSILGIRTLSSQAANQEPLAVSEQPAPSSPTDDSRYTLWQPGEYAPESEPTTEVVPALAPLPRPDLIKTSYSPLLPWRAPSRVLMGRGVLAEGVAAAE